MKHALQISTLHPAHAPDFHLQDSPVEMDPSVLHMDRPSAQTTSEPASRFASHVDRARGGTASGRVSPSGALDEPAGEEQLVERLERASLVANNDVPRQRAATSTGGEYAGDHSTITPREGSMTTSSGSHAGALRSTAADSTGVDSIFRLLPRETRPAIMAMMTIDPVSRCTLADLLQGTGNDALVCRCGGAECGGGMNTPPGTITPPNGEEGDDVDRGDEWLKAIRCCSHPGDAKPDHEHAKIESEEGAAKKKKFFH